MSKKAFIPDKELIRYANRHLKLKGIEPTECQVDYIAARVNRKRVYRKYRKLRKAEEKYANQALFPK